MYLLRESFWGELRKRMREWLGPMVEGNCPRLFLIFVNKLLITLFILLLMTLVSWSLSPHRVLPPILETSLFPWIVSPSLAEGCLFIFSSTPQEDTLGCVRPKTAPSLKQGSCSLNTAYPWGSFTYPSLLSLKNSIFQPYYTCWSWSSNTLATWCEEPTHWKRPWCWERLRTGGEGHDRGWDSWMASPTQWTWVWANSGRWWRKDREAWWPWGRKESDTNEWLKNNTLDRVLFHIIFISSKPLLVL